MDCYSALDFHGTPQLKQISLELGTFDYAAAWTVRGLILVR